MLSVKNFHYRLRQRRGAAQPGRLPYHPAQGEIGQNHPPIRPRRFFGFVPRRKPRALPIGSLLDMTYHPTWESFFFEPLGFQVAPGDYFFHRFEIRYRTDASKKLSADLKYYGGEYYDGGLDEWSASLRVAPSP